MTNRGRTRAESYNRAQRQARYRREVRRQSKKFLTLLGPQRESRLIRVLADAIEEGQHVPPWLYDLTPSNPKQDRQGVDVVAMSDIGPLFLQVKTSEVFARQFGVERRIKAANGRRNLIIGTIVVNDGLSDKQMVHTALAVLTNVRRQVEKYGTYEPRTKKRVTTGL